MARCPAGHESQASDYCDTCGLVIGGEAPAAASAPLATAVAAAATAAVPGAVSSGGAGGARCPDCQAERNGRFCEECGYDFDLAEAIPQVTMTPGVVPAEPEAALPTVPVTTPVAAPSAEAGGEAPGGQGLDLEAELARAEAESAPPVVTAGGGSGAAAPETESAASTPLSVFGSESESAASSGALSAFSGGIGGAGPAGRELSLVVDADADYYAAQIERGDIIEAEFPFPKYPHERRFTFTEGPVRIGRASSSRGLAPEIDLTGPPLDPAVSHLHAQLLRHDEGWVVVDLDSANGTRLNDAEEPLEAETEIPVKQGDRIHLGVWTTITVQ